MKPYKIIIFAIAALFIAGGISWAGGIKERMKQRLPVITSLKAQGFVGETNQGYLGFVSGTHANADVVDAENKDRKTIYMHIARQEKVSVGLVQKRRAQALAERAKPGHYVQNKSGSWVKK